MAVLENNTLQYYKINFNNSFIKDNNIYIHYSIYISEESREKEKIRNPLFESFSQAVIERLSQIEKEIEQTSEEDSIISLSSLHQSIFTPYQKLFRQLYGFRGKEEFSSEEKNILISLGAKEDWFEEINPVIGKVMLIRGISNFSLSSNEELSCKEYYQILKNSMNQEIIQDV